MSIYLGVRISPQSRQAGWFHPRANFFSSVLVVNSGRELTTHRTEIDRGQNFSCKQALKVIRSILCRKNWVADGVVVINKIEKEKQYENLELRGKICFMRNLNYNILVLDIEFESWIPNQTCIRPTEQNAKTWNNFYTSTPIFLQAYSNISLEATLADKKHEWMQNSCVWLLQRGLFRLF